MTTQIVNRLDRGGLEKPVKDPVTGWLRVAGYIGRTGLLEYRKADGSRWVEYRPEAEAFNADSLATFSLVPLTNDHPAAGYLDAANTAGHQVGTVGLPSRDGDKVRAQILVTDAAAIADLERGKAELSCGYSCDLDLTPGEYAGQRYDAIQRNLRGNHVALVTEGRAGPEVRVRMDSADMVLLPSPSEKHTQMIKTKINGVEFEVSESAAQAVALEQKAHADALAAAKASLDTQTARADSAEASVTKLTAEAKELPAKVRADMAARVSLESVATKILGETKLDGMTDLQVQVAVAEKVHSLKLDGKSEAYVSALFDLAVVKHATAAEEPVTKSLEHTDSTIGNDPVSQARAKFAEASRNAHRRTQES